MIDDSSTFQKSYEAILNNDTLSDELKEAIKFQMRRVLQAA